MDDVLLGTLDADVFAAFALLVGELKNPTAESAVVTKFAEGVARAEDTLAKAETLEDIGKVAMPTLKALYKFVYQSRCEFLRAILNLPKVLFVDRTDIPGFTGASSVQEVEDTIALRALSEKPPQIFGVS